MNEPDTLFYDENGDVRNLGFPLDPKTGLKQMKADEKCKNKNG